MQICSNCSSSFDEAKSGLVTTGAGRTVAAVCGECCRGVCVGKIVVRRAGVNAFAYEQWSPTEMIGDVPS
jgi:hypothetical protein